MTHARYVLGMSLVTLSLSATALGQASGMDAATLAHRLDRLENTGRVLYIAAHPDDENTRLLAYLANAKHVTAAYLSMTRGGGGQNLIGKEQGALLDVLRTEELLAARAVDGAQQRFTRVRDFGYSKSADETLARWGHEAALADVVWTIRTFQPDLIITRFDERPPNHGHHTASAILAREAFAAAADPLRFPEQFARGAEVWQATRLVHNLSPWREEPVPRDALTLDVGGYDPRFGLSYGELAAVSRSQHKSQGFGVAGERGSLIERFVHVAGSKAKETLFDDIDLDWQRFGQLGRQLDKHLVEARFAMERDNPQWALPALLRAHEAILALPQRNVRVRDAKRELDAIIAHVAGLFVRATTKSPTVTPGSNVTVDVEVVLRRPADMRLTQLKVGEALAQPMDLALVVDRKNVLTREVRLSRDAAFSVPSFLRPGRHPSDAPKDRPALEVTVHIQIAKRTLEFVVPVSHAWTDRVHGERLRDVVVTPALTVTPRRDAVLAANGKGASVEFTVRAQVPKARGVIALKAPGGWSVSPKELPVALEGSGDELLVRFEVTPSGNAKPGELTPQLDGAQALREDTLDYPHVPVTLVLQPATVRIATLSARLPKGLVGYVQGSGDTLPQDLAHVGVRVELLDDEALRAADLSRYTALVVGIRAYNTRAALRAAHGRLMSYVERGGTVVVQYNTHSKQAPLTTSIGPYPITLGRGRVTHPDAPVSLTQPAHELLTTPNPIVATDFDGWVHERGLYYAESWDPRFETLLTAADPDEAPLLGGVLYARHGRGRYIYTGLSFFRQLPAGVPGAYRLLLNFIGGT